MGVLSKLTRIVEDTLLRDDASIHDVVQNRILHFPPDKYGVPCLLDDIVWYRDTKHLVVAINRNGKVAIRNLNNRDGKGTFWLKSVQVTHGRER